MTNTPHTALDYLARYGRHDDTCPLFGSPILPGDSRCLCGLSICYKRAEESVSPSLLAQRNELREALQDMVDMMDSGEEHGKGSPWHTKAKAALAKANP